MAQFTCCLLALCAFVIICVGSGTDAKLLPRRLLENSCTQTVETWGQCGGKTCPDGSGSNCNDEAYNCCPSDNSCERQNEWYWQCLPRSSGSSPMPARVFESHIATQPANVCMVVGNNADYPNGLQCQGYLSFPACCQGSDCHVYKFWDGSATNTAYLTSESGGELASSSGACHKDFTLGCCPAVAPGQ